jgi:chaperonin GroES
VLKNCRAPLAEKKCPTYVARERPTGSSHRGAADSKSSSDYPGGSHEVPPASRPCRRQRIEAEEKTAGGIIIPDTAKEKPQQGEVVSVGPGGRDEAGKLIPIDVKPGDRVLFGKWSGTEVKLDGVEYLIMKESDIMGVLDVPVAKKKAA